MKAKNGSAQPHGSLPDDLYVGLVDALFQDRGSLIMGSATTTIAAVTVALIESTAWAWAFVGLFLSIAVLRLRDFTLHQRARGEATVPSAKKWERRYVLGASAYVGALDEILANPAIASRRGAFTEAASGIVAESFDKTKKGTLRAQDAKAIAKMLGGLHAMASEVNSEGLIAAIAQAHATLGELNAFFGFQQGSRAGAAFQNWGELQEKRNQLVETRPGYAKDIAEERLQSFAGKLKLLEGTIETLQIRIASAFDNDGKGGGPLSMLASAATAAGNALIELPDGVVRLGSELGALGVAVASLRGMGAIAGTVKMGRLAALMGGGSSLLGMFGLYGLGASAAYGAATDERIAIGIVRDLLRLSEPVGGDQKTIQRSTCPVESS